MDTIHVDLTPDECQAIQTFWESAQKNPQLQQMFSQEGNNEQQIQSAFGKISNSYSSYSSS